MKKSIGSGRGSVYNILLKALQTGDKYGYEICKEIEEKSNGAYILKQPSLYSGLKRLEAQNLITSYWRDSDLGGRRHYYSLTDAGRQKIENSDFSWEDTREDFVNTLFEKTQTESEIDDIVKQVDDLKQQAQNSTQLQQDIDDILTSTQSLANDKNQNADMYNQADDLQNEDITELDEKESKNTEQVDLFSYNNSDDLFSMFNHYNNNQTDDSQEENKENSTENDFENDNLNNENELKQDFITNEAIADENAFDDTETSLDNETVANIKDEIDQELTDDENDFDEEEIETITENYYIEETEQPTHNEYDDVIESNDYIDDKQLDLFSFVNSVQEDDYEETEKVYDEQEEIDEYDDIIKNFTTYQTEQNVDNQIENNLKNDNLNVEQELQENIDSISDQNEQIESYDDQFENINNQSDLELIDGFENNYQKINESQEDINENQNNVDLQNTIEENNIDLQNTSQEDNEFDQEVYLQANSSNFLQDYKNNKEKNSFVENTKQETAEKSFFGQDDFSMFDFEDTTLNFEHNDETSTEDLQANTLNTVENFDNVNQDNINIENTENTKNKNLTNESTIDYVNIFGDLISNNDANVIDNNVTENTNEIDKTSEPQQTYIDDLPRVNLNNNINRTLELDQEMMQDINNHYYEENPIEKLDSKIKEELNQEQPTVQQQTYQQSSNPIKDLPFDKKYDNVFNHFEVPDYQVRYYKKPTNQTKQSKFVSINKLNLTSSIIFCILMFICTTTTLICTSLQTKISGTQIVYYVLSFVIPFVIVLFHFLKYIANKNKKSMNINKNELVYNAFFSVVIIILTVALNILFGMNLTNILSYSATFILPLCYAVLIIFNPLLKKFLSKFSSFYIN